MKEKLKEFMNQYSSYDDSYDKYYIIDEDELDEFLTNIIKEIK